MAAKLLNKSKISDVFKSMDYQNVPIDTSVAEERLYVLYGNQNTEGPTAKITFDEKKAPIYFPCLNTPFDAKKIFEDTKNDTRWRELSAGTKSAAIYEFAKEIDKNSEFLSQLELLFRNILPRDTQKYGIPLLKDYLKYYANYTDGIHTNPLDDENVVLCLTSMVFSLAEIGFFLGSVLAQGSNIIFYGEDSIVVILNFLIELSIKAGIPNGTIKVFYGSDGTFQTLSKFQIYKNIKIGDITKFDDKKVLITPHLKTSMIVFNDADLDSACESAVTAIWSCCGLLPWAVDTILVQEDIFLPFLNKLKERVKKLQFGDKPSVSDDISFYRLANWVTAVEKTVKDVKSQGIEVYQPKSGKKLQPTLFIGGKASGNKVMTEHSIQVPMGSLLAFRTPKEAVSLANNSQQGLAASVWTQNVSLINEVSRKLDVGTVWVNCHGIFDPTVGFTTRKYEGVGFIGGQEGLYEFSEASSSTIDVKSKSSGLLGAAKKAQESWGRLRFGDRVEKLSKFFENNLNFRKAIRELSSTNTTQTIGNFDLKVYRDPIGVVVVNKTGETAIEIVINALLLGNAVLVIEDERIKTKIDSLSKHLPSGVLINASISEVSTAFDSLKQYVVIIGNEKPIKRALHCQKHYDIFDKMEISKFALRRCTISKNVFIDVGDSF